MCVIMLQILANIFKDILFPIASAFMVADTFQTMKGGHFTKYKSNRTYSFCFVICSFNITTRRNVGMSKKEDKYEGGTGRVLA